MVICMVFCIDSVAGIMPIITCPGCNSTNTRFCHEKGFVENTRFCRKTGFIANMRLFGFVWCRLLRRHLGFDSDFAQISGLKIGGWHLCPRHWHKNGIPQQPINKIGIRQIGAKTISWIFLLKRTEGSIVLEQ